MLSDQLVNANVLQWLGQKVNDRMFRPSGWEVPDDTDTGLSFGDGIEGGGGYMEMDIQDLRQPNIPVRSLRGIYGELGIGAGEISKLQGPINKVVKTLKGAKPSSDFVVAPGGSLYPFIMGPLTDQRNLELDDFKYASWLYVHIGYEVAVLAGDVGLMFMIDKGKVLKLLPQFLTMQIGTLVPQLLLECKAWAPYWGLSAGLGAGGKFAVRYIQSVQMSG
jgi:hypothetical protein